MRSENLSPKQYERLHEKIRPINAYLTRLIQRMNKRRFPREDPLMRKVLAASAAIHDLEVHTHYGSCGPPGLSPLAKPRDASDWRVID
jgi:hypothetical protein